MRRGASFLDAVLLSETVYASCGVDEFLLAGKERVAGGANFHLNILYRRTGLNDIAARARDRCELVLRVYPALHSDLLARRSCLPEYRLYDGY